MALAKTHTIAIDGVVAHPVEVEAHIGTGLPGITIVGMADTSISEARSRIRTAVTQSELDWPKTRIVVSMAPASLPKSGTHFDLPIALAILAARAGLGGIAAQSADAVLAASPSAAVLGGTLFLGEVGLDGSIRPVSGVLPAAVAAQEYGFDCLVIPVGNAPEACLVEGVEILVVHTLKQAVAFVRGLTRLESARDVVSQRTQLGARQDVVKCFSDIAGQAEAKRAAEIAAAGGHHLLMIGPPGSGKSMLAARLPSILPQLSTRQSLEATAIHSLAGKVGQAVLQAPFVAPHPSVTRAGLVGGGSGRARPGAASLAHHGVLFLDEASEVAAEALDSLRAPLEEGHVRLVRARREVIFPARFQLVLAANPCRCAAEEPAACVCKPAQRASYLHNLSGPLRDRLDMVITLSGRSARLDAAGEETSASIAQRVAAARERGAHRWARAELDAETNAAVGAAWLRRNFPATDEAMELLRAYLAAGEVSQRGVDRSLKLAWTLADLHGISRPGMEEVSQAIDLRGTDTYGKWGQ
ncbi:YifB family Mg chelatase-like AAA ATPase [Corynebacterium lizhenjunii]|uniref:YifB family Mg chelatase-like AAA ATPase n=1 Tax=Corynebacterium lizhenjunii TaxID=2709394 RepID=A0A7T0KCU7_9CORY|nr:YifB family Mg chelatase-like AAA ATPase [Corynebacterium lizhenjunii]QPK78426.1 YifB family Mg chelatase-like AAA ATPase [Corynebacterium lizhenjunii]